MYPLDMQKQKTRLVGTAFGLIVSISLIYYWDLNIPSASVGKIAFPYLIKLDQTEFPDSEDCLLIRRAIQASDLDFFNGHNVSKYYPAPTLNCIEYRMSVEVQRYKLTYDHHSYGPTLYAGGPIYSAPHTFALVALVRGGSFGGTTSSCYLQRWPWGWAVLGCRRGFYLV